MFKQYLELNVPIQGIRSIETKHFMGILVLACVFWWIIFGLQLVNFWLGMAVAASCLAILSYYLIGSVVRRADFTKPAWVMGLVTAIILYLLFWLGHVVACWIFGFAATQVSSIYLIRTEANPWLISLVLVFITSPAEEIFWRGFVQSYTVNHWGATKGVLLAALIYGLVHVFSGNIMLTLAALVAGLFWGIIYALTKNLAVCIISHALWTVGIFILFPITN